MTTLLHERGTLGFALQAALEIAVRKLVSLARERGATPLQRDRIAREWIELQALRYTNLRALTSLVETAIPGPEGSIAKLQWSEANQRLTKLALELLGPEAQLPTATAATGSTSSSAAAATRSRPGRPRSSATSSPSACSACRGRASGRRLHRRAAGAPHAAREFLDANPEPRLAAARGARLDGGLRAEEQGGAGLGFVEEAAIAEELGRALVAGPWLSTTALLPALPAEDQAEVAAGEASWTIALDELVAGLDAATRSRRRRRRRSTSWTGRA